MHPIIYGLRGLYDSLLWGLNSISVIVIFWMALWVFADVVGRYFFNHPIAGTTELVKTGLIGIVFLGVAYTLQQGRHIRTTVVLDRLSRKPRSFFKMFGSLLGVLIFSLLCVYSWYGAWDSWLVREFDGTQLKVPVYPSRFIVVLGSGLFAVQSFLDFWQDLRIFLKGRTE